MLTKFVFADRFIENIEKHDLTTRNFAMDDELKALLPASVTDKIDVRKISARRSAELERVAAERQAERQAQAAAGGGDDPRWAMTPAARIEAFAPFGVDTAASKSWEVGDYIVMKEFLLRPDYPVPVRKVVSRNGREYTALKISDLAAFARNGAISDPRTTIHKSEWVKSQL